MHLKQLIVVTCMYISVWTIIGAQDPPGHMKPLGAHADPIGGIIEIGKFPSPWVFYEDFVKEGRPLWMRNVLKYGDIPAFEKWSDSYLSDIFGHIPVEVESKKKEDRENGTLRSMTLKRYIKIYKDLDRYLVTDIPEELKVDIKVPLSLQCGGFQDSLQHVIMWFSSGGTKSHLHDDGLDNINCVLDGTKDIVLIDKKYKDLVEADGWKEEGAFSLVDVEKVDMYKFPKLQHVPWNKITVNKGDCLFIPIKWYHQVHSLPGRNLALNFWFTHRLWYNSSQCTDMDPYEAPSKPLTKFDYPYVLEESRGIFLESLEGKDLVTREDFFGLFENPSENEEQIQECFSTVDEDSNGSLEWPELYKFDLGKMMATYPQLFKGMQSEDEEDEKTQKNVIPYEDEVYDDMAEEEESVEEDSNLYLEKDNSAKYVQTETVENVVQEEIVVDIEHTKKERKTVVNFDSTRTEIKHEEL